MCGAGNGRLELYAAGTGYCFEVFVTAAAEQEQQGAALPHVSCEFPEPGDGVRRLERGRDAFQAG